MTLDGTETHAARWLLRWDQACALEAEAVGSVAGLQVHYAARPESGDRPAHWQSNTLEEHARGVHDIVYKLTVLRQRRHARQNPEVAVAIGESRVDADWWQI